MSKGQPVIIVKKKGHGGHGHHGGAWKVAYADFVTAMMAFFLVMWLVGQSPGEGGRGRLLPRPGVFETTRGGGVLPGGAEGLKEIRRHADGGTGQREAGAGSARAGGRAPARGARRRFPSLQGARGSHRDHGHCGGLRIELLENEKNSFFAVGSAQLLPETVRTARRDREGAEPARQHGRARRAHRQPRVHGGERLHATGSCPPIARIPRAGRWRRHGLRAGQIDAVRGFADTRLRYPDDSLDPRNRRISIVVQSGS